MLKWLVKEEDIGGKCIQNSFPTCTFTPDESFYQEIVNLSTKEHKQFLQYCLDKVKEQIKKDASNGSSYCCYQSVIPKEVRTYLTLSGFSVRSDSVDKHYIYWSRDVQL